MDYLPSSPLPLFRLYAAGNFCRRCFWLFFVSSIIALLTIFPPIFTSSFTFTLKVILLSFVSVISGYFASILPFSNFSSTESVPAPSAFKLFSTYSKPSGKVSSIFTSASFPFSTVFLKLIRYSTSSPNFGNRLFTTFSLQVFRLYAAE